METKDAQQQYTRYKSFLAQDPDNINLICQTSQLGLQLGNIAEARELLSAALQKHPDSTALKFNFSNILLASQEYNLASEILTELLTQEDNPAIRYNLAYATMFAGNYKQATELFASIVEETGTAPDTSYWLGRCYYHLGDTANANKYLRIHVANNPQRADSIGTLAMLNMDMENLEEAKSLAEKALTINNNNLEALVTLGNVYLNDQDDDTANSFFSQATEKHPTSGRAWAGLGLTDMLRTNLPKAISDLKKAVQYMPGHIGTWHALAWAQITSNDIDGAKNSFEAAMNIDRNFGETHGGLAVIDVLQKNHESAKERIRRALKLDSNSFSARFAQSLLLQESDPEKAQHIIKNIMAFQLAEGKTLQDTLSKALRKQAGNQPGSKTH